jgi:hypothetical protein
MRILLDECVPQQVRHALPDHEVATVEGMAWKGFSNGRLIDAAERAGFALFIVADKNLRHQQNLSARRIAILELWTNHRPTLEKHFSHIHAAVARIKPGEYLVLDSP